MIPDRKGGFFRFLRMNFRKSAQQDHSEIAEDSAVIASKRRIEERIELALHVRDDSSPERRMLALAVAPRVPALQKPPSVPGLFVAEDYYLEAQNEGWLQEKAG
jgi:hypothetical protein